MTHGPLPWFIWQDHGIAWLWVLAQREHRKCNATKHSKVWDLFGELSLHRWACSRGKHNEDKTRFSFDIIKLYTTDNGQGIYSNTRSFKFSVEHIWYMSLNMYHVRNKMTSWEPESFLISTYYQLQYITTEIRVNTYSGNGLLPVGTKSLPEQC